MVRSNDEIAALFAEYADLISITGGDAYKARVYEKAARSVGGYHADVATLDLKALLEIPNVGKSIAEKITEYVRTGNVPAVEELRARIPVGVRRLAAIPTLGPKTEENILHGIELLRSSGDRVLLDAAMDLAEDVIGALSQVTGCQRCAYAGSLRRLREAIGDLDILVAARKPVPVMRAFTELAYVSEVITHGEKKTSIRTAKGLPVELRVVAPGSWGTALQYFTGSKAHNIRTRELAVHQKLKLSEYGLFDAESGKKIVSETEEEVYDRLGLPWIPPALREDRGETEAGLRGELPELDEESDLLGDPHTHTDLTDGLAPLEDMVAAAAERGFAYYAVTDHGPDLSMQRMTDARMLAQREQVRELDGAFGGNRDGRGGMRLLPGAELNIGPDGEVDWPDEFLAGFDLCVASVHSHFNQSREALTRRIVRACESPYINIIGHPTARIIGKRPGIDADLDEVFAACARTGTALEINAHRTASTCATRTSCGPGVTGCGSPSTATPTPPSTKRRPHLAGFFILV